MKENRRGGDVHANAVSPFGDGMPHGSLRYFDDESSGVPVSSLATLTPSTRIRTLSAELVRSAFGGGSLPKRKSTYITSQLAMTMSTTNVVALVRATFKRKFAPL